MLEALAVAWQGLVTGLREAGHWIPVRHNCSQQASAYSCLSLSDQKIKVDIFFSFLIIDQDQQGVCLLTVSDLS